MSIIWNDIAKDWEKIPLDTYKFLFEQTKDRYEEVMSESESVTNKSITLISISGAIVTGFVGFKFQANPPLSWVIILGILYLSNFICLIKLLFPKKVVLRGSPPNEIFIDYFDHPDLLENEKTSLAYYHELIRYQERINEMDMRIARRQNFYRIALLLTIFNAVLTAAIVVKTIYHP